MTLPTNKLGYHLSGLAMRLRYKLSFRDICQAYDSVRQFLRPRAQMAFVSLSEQRERFLARVNELQ